MFCRPVDSFCIGITGNDVRPLKRPLDLLIRGGQHKNTIPGHGRSSMPVQAATDASNRSRWENLMPIGQCGSSNLDRPANRDLSYNPKELEGMGNGRRRRAFLFPGYFLAVGVATLARSRAISLMPRPILSMSMLGNKGRPRGARRDQGG
jgi:hypothetical protein